MARFAAIGLILVALAGCSATTAVPGKAHKLDGASASVSLPMISCAEATRATRAALQRMGYTLTDVKTPEPGAPGVVSGAREKGWSGYDPNSHGKDLIQVDIECSDTGAALEASSSEGGIAGLGFANLFKSTLAGEVGNKTERPRLESEKSRGLILKVEPQRSAASLEVFGVDLPAAGVVPVRVEMDNQSDRRYSFDAAAVALYTVQGNREMPLAIDAAAQKIKAPGSQSGSQLLRQHALEPGELGPGEKLVGYLYFSASTYERARVTVTDIESEEAEGFSVRF